ncbi:MAG TPA: DoxX family protein [Phycisphaerae bacterium]|nr:DoxX family protein [Phycisphaerae bacterium]
MTARTLAGRGGMWVPLRVVMGVGFLMHGLAKWQRGPEHFAALLGQIGAPAPGVTAWVVTLLETFGGVALIVGAFVAVVSVPLIVSMVVAMWTVQGRYGFSSVNTIGLTASGPVFGPPGYEINLLYIAGLVAVGFSGAGAWSVDGWLGKRKGARGKMNGAEGRLGGAAEGGG